MRHELTVRISKDVLLKHFLICGASGSGKSLLMQAMFYDMIRTSRKRQHGLILIEPHGDFSGKIAFARIIDRDRLLLISSGSTINRDAHVTGMTGIFNPFANDGTEEMRYLLTQELTNAIAELLESSQHATQYGITIQMATLLSPAIAVTLASPQPCIHTLLRFMDDKNNEDLLAIARNFPHPHIREFFAKFWHAEQYKVSKASILTKLSYFLNDIHLYNMLAYQPSNGFSLEDHINKGSVLIFHLPKGAGGFVSHFIGRLAIAYVLAIVMRREAIPPAKRKPVFMFIDEAQAFVTPSLANILQEARKMGLGLILATQNVKSIDPKVRQAIMTNTFTKAISVSDAESRVLFAREMGIEADKLAKLEPLHFMLKRMDGATTPFRFKVPILNNNLFLSEKEKQDLYKYLIEKSGIYAAVPPLPPAPPTPVTPDKPLTQGKRSDNEKKTPKKKKDEPFDGLTPAF